MSAQRVATIIGGAGVLGYGGYFAMQQKEIKKNETELFAVEKMVFNEKKALKAAETAIADSESQLKELSQKEETERKAVREVETKLDAARQQVAVLEAQLATKQEAVQKISQETSSLASRLSGLRSEGDRSREALTMGEKSLAIARQKVSESKKLLNPLQHPKLVSLLGKK